MMNDGEFVKELIRRANSHDDGYFEYAHLAACLFPKSLIEQLGQLVNGPVWDGNIISKADRAALFDLGLAIRVCCKGEQGYTGATYFAHTILKAINEIDAGRRAA